MTLIITESKKAGDYIMRRTLTVIAAAVATLFGGMGVANATAAEVEQQAAAIPTGLYISEFATAQGVGPNATFKEFIELKYRGAAKEVTIGGARLFANFSRFGPDIEIAQIPFGVHLKKGETYLVASPQFRGPVAPKRLFNADVELRDAVGISLKTVMGRQLDVVGTTPNTRYVSGDPASPLTEEEAADRMSLTRVDFTGNNVVDFQKLKATPGR
jgi:hypothetical protein